MATRFINSSKFGDPGMRHRSFMEGDINTSVIYIPYNTSDAARVYPRETEGLDSPDNKNDTKINTKDEVVTKQTA